MIERTWSDGEITVRYFAFWSYRCWPPKLVTPDFEAIQREHRRRKGIVGVTPDTNMADDLSPWARSAVLTPDDFALIRDMAARDGLWLVGRFGAERYRFQELEKAGTGQAPVAAPQPRPRLRTHAEGAGVRGRDDRRRSS